MRGCGILLPVSSLPGKYGIGTFGKEAYDFIDLLKKMDQKYWQILPLGPTTFGDSPYQTYSTFAGSENYLNLEELYQDKLITKKELDSMVTPLSNVDYVKLKETRMPLYKKASKKFFQKLPQDFENFQKANESWLEAYVTFRSLKEYYQGKCFNEWDEDVIKGHLSEEIKEKIAEDKNMHLFIQYYFFKEWLSLKEYANKQGIKIIGDLPIYVSYDSSDVWQNPKNFELDEDLRPTRVAGCPPDAFSSDGQLWGNPLYDYKEMKKTSYKWWVERIIHSLKMFDVLRIDHFRGFAGFFAIPATDKTAKNGVWEKGPGFDIFEELFKKVTNPKMIMEDLGYLTPDVYQLLKKTKFPGMRVLEFAFDGRKENDYLPHNYLQNTVVYTGTHDNMPLVGWVKTLSKDQVNQIFNYFNITKVNEIPDTLIKAALASIADTAIIPLQDYLHLDENSRINTPSTVGNNWSFRIDLNLVTEETIETVKEYVKKYYR